MLAYLFRPIPSQCDADKDAAHHADNNLCRRCVEIGQFNRLSDMLRDLGDHEFMANHTLDDAAVAALGVRRAADLDVDSSSPCDFEPRFFRPWREPSEAVDEIRARCWYSRWTLDPSEDNTGMLEAPWELGQWFARALSDLYGFEPYEESSLILEYIQSGYKFYDQCDFAELPVDMGWNSYVVSGANLPADETCTPHAVVMLHDTVVPQEGMILYSELHAALWMAKSLARYGYFMNHHTRPVLVLSFLSDSNGRITQAYFDSKIDKLVIRQSRLLHFPYNPDGSAPEDVVTMARWRLALQTGNTEYPPETDENAKPRRHGYAKRGQGTLVTAAAS